MSQAPELMPAAALLDYLHDPAWFGDREAKEIFVRYYTPVSVPEDRIGPDNTFQKYEVSGVPIRSLLVEISDQVYMSHHPSWTSSPKGDTVLVVERIQRKLPRSLYLLLSTPLSPVQDWQTAARNLDKLAALVRCSLGTNFVFSIAREAIVSIPGGSMVTPTPIMPTPQAPDGPFLASQNVASLQELIGALRSAGRELSDRALFALELFERGAQQLAGLKFFSYWIAIEVLCGTDSTGKILTKLTKAYGSSRSDIQNRLGFDAVKVLRTELFHHGRQHDMPQDVERYVQAMFLDLFRLHLGLPHEGHMRQAVERGFCVERLRREVGLSNVLAINVREAAAEQDRGRTDGAG